MNQRFGKEGFFEGGCEFDYPGVVGAFLTGDSWGSDRGGASESELFKEGASRSRASEGYCVCMWRCGWGCVELPVSGCGGCDHGGVGDGVRCGGMQAWFLWWLWIGGLWGCEVWVGSVVLLGFFAGYKEAGET